MWDAEWRAGGFQDLSEDECWELLGSHAVGRVAFVGDEGVEVLPVNFVVAERGVVFRTSPYAVIARRAPGQEVAFQVDDVDEFQRAGWSVLLQGRAEAHELPPPAGADAPEPWPQGLRVQTIRIRPRRVTGRRVLGH